MIEHDDEELSSSADVSPLASCAAPHAFSGSIAAEPHGAMCSPPSAGAACREHDAVNMGYLGSPMGSSAAFAATYLMHGHVGSSEGDVQHITNSSMATTRGSAALLEAAVSSTLMHPNIVQVRGLAPCLHAVCASQEADSYIRQQLYIHLFWCRPSTTMWYMHQHRVNAPSQPTAQG